LDGEKNLGRTQPQSGASSLLANIVSKQLYRKCISEKYMEKIHEEKHAKYMQKPLNAI